MEFVKRENEIVHTLKSLAEEKLDFVVVGDYAVSGLGKHRFSADCDVVVPKKEKGRTEAVLKKNEFEKDFEKRGFDDTYAGEFVRFKKKAGELPVTFDVLVGSLVCRTTGGSWSFEYIRKYSVQTTIAGIETVVDCSVPEKELMIAFKIHSARRTDVRDIIMMMEKVDLDKVLTHLRRGEVETLRNQINNIFEMLNDEKLVDSLKGVFTLTIDVRKQIENIRKNIETILKGLK